LTRIKNGIMVDSFIDHSVGDTSSPDYKCSIDIRNKELRSLFIQRAFTLYPFTNNGLSIENGFAVKSYTLETFISQTKASRKVNINPYSVFLWRGTVTLNPSTDIWKDTKTLPAPINNNVQTAPITLTFSSQFNDWVETWTGGEEIFEDEITWVPQRDSFDQITWANDRNSNLTLTWNNPFTGEPINPPIFVRTSRNPDGTESFAGILPAMRQVNRRFVGRTPVVTTGRWVQRTETNQVTIQRTSQSLGEVVVRVNNIPFIRPRTVQFTATGLKPNTTLYAFFDDVNVTNFITPSPLVTNASGAVSGTFNIPANRFLTGERVFRLTDSPTNNREQETTYAEARYFAQGLEEERTTLMVNIPEISIQSNRTVQPVDPLAQSFFVDPIIYPEGIFVKEVDIFFAKKDNAIPVILQIRENVNGYPSNTSIIAEVLKTASSVNVSSNGSVATTFTFPNPIYLKPGEYSLVLISNSDNYEVWVAKIGENEVINNTLISEQPYVGSLFKSQNASTWTAEQTEDLKFVIRKCSFVTGDFDLVLSDFVSTNEPDISVELPVITNSASGTNTIFVGGISERNIVVGSEVYHSSIPSGTKVTAINMFEGRLTLSQNLTANLNAGQRVIVRRKAEATNENNRMDLFKANVSIFNPFSTTDVAYSFVSKLWGQTNIESSYTTFNINDNYFFTSPRNVDAAKESFRLKISGRVKNKNVSPVINLNRNYIVGVENIINYPSSISETNSTGGNCQARYITKRMVLEDSASYLKVYFDLYRPLGTDVKVYYRTLTENDQTPIDNKNWEELNSVSNLNNVYSNSVKDFFETAWVPSQNNLNSFIELQIKIVMLSNNTSVIPRIKRLRVLALD
ncbi:MAG: DUF4815 domain-containing protein, partial [Patescibacteria group bacterium]|nr:DUF4815 domain-containing protein [Patescibacteria group bacterium]